MMPGISTACLYPLNTEESFRALLALEPDCMEVFLNSTLELESSFLRELRREADSAGTKIVSVHPYLSPMEPMFFFSGYARRFVEGMELYRRFYEAAGILGADCLVFHGEYRRSPLSWDDYFILFERLWEDAQKHGVSLCQENVERCFSGSNQFLARMRKTLPQVEYILDVKQTVRAGESIFDMARTMGDKIRHIHISDHNERESCLPPGKGILNTGKLLDLIGKNGFRGGVIVELYGENFGDIVELSDSFQQLRDTLSTRP